MRTTRVALVAIAVVFFGLVAMRGPAGSAAPAPTAESVTLRDINYDDLGKLVHTYKGKVVVVDFWGEY
jgi:hypothetical protein